MKRKKGYQLFDVPNNKRGRRFFEDLQEFLNKDWYGYQRRGRLPKPGVKLNHQKQARAEDSSSWAIYIRGVPVSKEFLEHSAAKRLDDVMKMYHKEFDERVGTEKAYDELNKTHHSLKEAYTKKVEESKQAKVKLEKYKLRLFRWNISLWKEERREGHI